MAISPKPDKKLIAGPMLAAAEMSRDGKGGPAEALLASDVGRRAPWLDEGHRFSLLTADPPDAMASALVTCPFYSPDQACVRCPADAGKYWMKWVTRYVITLRLQQRAHCRRYWRGHRPGSGHGTMPANLGVLSAV